MQYLLLLLNLQLLCLNRQYVKTEVIWIMSPLFYSFCERGAKLDGSYLDKAEWLHNYWQIWAEGTKQASHQELKGKEVYM